MPRFLQIIIYVGVISLSAQLTIDLNLPNVTIPISGQTLAILTGAVFLKPVESLIAICIYCIIGIFGLPVFSDGGAGWSAFSGPSLGYFVGFVVAAVFMSYMTDRGNTESILHLLSITIVATLIILILGSLNLAREHGLQKGIEYGLSPFILGGLVKAMIGVVLVTGIRKAMISNGV